MAAPGQAAEVVAIQSIEPTPLFPKAAPGQPLRQRALLCLDNPGPPLAVRAKITLGTTTATVDLGELRSGKSTNAVLVPDHRRTGHKLTVELLPTPGDSVLAAARD